jgi:hypothetical protein
VEGGVVTVRHETNWSLRADPFAVRVHRNRILEQVRAWGYGLDRDLADTLLLLSSELLTNGVRYGEDGMLTVVICGQQGEVFIGVMDGSRAEPVVRHAGTETPGGRGLKLVAALAKSWGTHPTEAGKAVWFTLKVPHFSTLTLPATATESDLASPSLRGSDVLAGTR